MATHSNDRPVGDVIRDLFEDLSRLVRGEIALLKAEMQENLAKIGTGAGLLGGAGILGLFTMLFVFLAIMFALIDLGLKSWLAALLVAVGLGIIAAILAVSGKKSVSQASVAPTETVHQVKSDAQHIKRDVEQLRSK